MVYIDAHCDTITKIMETGESLRQNKCHIDLERIKARKVNSVQFFAAFISPRYGQAYALKRAIQIIDKFYQELNTNNDVMMLCCNYDEIINSFSENKIAAVLSIEGGAALQGELAALRMFYKLGVRSICMTWNHRNEIADGVAEEGTGGGLTDFGRQVIKEMNEIGMLVDLSHISEKGFWDVMDITTYPIIVSHSNAKSICSNRRNLTDKQIEAVKSNNGVIGINLYPYFLTDSESASLADAMKHIEHIIGISGENHIGIGSDFDGIECTPVDIKGIEHIENIFNEMLKLNYSEGCVKKIAGENFLRLIKDVLK